MSADAPLQSRISAVCLKTVPGARVDRAEDGSGMLFVGPGFVLEAASADAFELILQHFEAPASVGALVSEYDDETAGSLARLCVYLLNRGVLARCFQKLVTVSACPACGSGQSRSVSSAQLTGMEPHFHARACDACGSVYLAERPVDEELELTFSALGGDQDHGISELVNPLLEQSAPSVKQYGVVPRFLSYASNVMRFAQPGPRDAVLDVGCADGGFLSVLRARTAAVLEGLDLDGRALEQAKSRVEGLVTHEGRLATAALPERHYRAITGWLVVEHEPDPQPFMRRARQLLADGGVLLLEVPAFSGWRLAEPKALMFPYHPIHYTEDGLSRALERAGLSVITAERGHFGTPPRMFYDPELVGALPQGLQDKLTLWGAHLGRVLPRGFGPRLFVAARR